jgi:hypothetical protein
MSTAEIEGHRIRLEAYFAQHRVPPAEGRDEIKRLLVKYRDPATGGFDKMWRHLHKKYDGDEGAGGRATDNTTTDNKWTFYDDIRIAQERKKLTHFYQQHAPAKVAEADKNIKKYSRMEDGFLDMWRALTKKYNAEEPRIEDIAGNTDGSRRSKRGDPTPPPPQTPPPGPPPAAKADSTTAASVSAINDAATSSHADAEDAHRARLYRFYAKYAPHKTGDVSKNLRKYADPESGGYSRMWQQLVDRYGPEPVNEERLLASMLDNGQRPGRRYAPDVREKWRQRLRKFYTYYAPQKGPDDVEDTLDRYAPPDGYEQMWAQLLEKYGAEPLEPASGFVGRFLGAEEVVEKQVHDDIFGVSHVPPTAAVLEENRLAASPPSDSEASPTSPARRGGRAISEDAPSELSSNANPERFPYSPLGFNAVAVVLHALLRLQGATVLLYDKAIDERKKNFRKAVEMEVALNLGIERRQVSVMAVKAGISIELAIELTHEQVKHGVGEALVTRVLMGTFTVRHIRESYKRDLGGNPIQLHTEGAAIYGGTCTPLFYDDAPHKPIDDTHVLLNLRSSTKEVADQWAREGSAGASVTPPRNVAARGASLQPPVVQSPGGKTVSSIASPMLSPRSDVQYTDPHNGMQSVMSGVQSPQRGWGSVQQRLPTLTPAELAESAMDHDARRTHRALMNPHHLETKPSTAPIHLIAPSDTTTFLEQVWGSNRRNTAQPLPYTTMTKPYERTADGMAIAPGSISGEHWKERARREMAKPIVMSSAPSTDDIPLVTRTAAPTVTVFRPEALLETHSTATTRFREDTERRRADHRHASELLSAIRSPVEYQLQQQQSKGSHNGQTRSSSSYAYATRYRWRPWEAGAVTDRSSIPRTTTCPMCNRAEHRNRCVGIR